MRPEVPFPPDLSIHILMGHLRCTSEKKNKFLYAMETNPDNGDGVTQIFSTLSLSSFAH